MCIDRCRWVLGNVSPPYWVTCTLAACTSDDSLYDGMTIVSSCLQPFRRGETRRAAWTTDRQISLIPPPSYIHSILLILYVSPSPHTHKPKIGVGRQLCEVKERVWTWRLGWSWAVADADADEVEKKQVYKMADTTEQVNVSPHKVSCSKLMSFLLSFEIGII